MREIKFRAWHKEYKALRAVAEINFSWHPAPDKTVRGRITVWDHPSVQTAMIKGSTDMWFLDDCELMQYMGLKDKHGKEIYEGDIIRFQRVLYGEWFTGVVKHWGYSVEIEFTEDEEGRDHWRMGSTTEYGREVIGNIYENPELLEQK